MNEIIQIFSQSGELSKLIKGFQPRVGQLEMALAVAEAIDKKQNLIAEAGTGTGKTFAYLASAILSGKKTIISTGTKNLQDQLFNQDLPVLRKAIRRPFKASLLKGRGNYLCLYRLKNALESNFGFNKDQAISLAKIAGWAKQTGTGDISEMYEVSEADPVWYQATSSVDNCLGSDCPDYAACLLVKARKKALESELLVINHHLLCADWSIRELAFGELLPSVEVIVIDEAHQLAEIASNFLGMHISSNQLNDLASDTLIEYFKDATDIPALRTACEELQHEITTLRMAFGIELRRGEWEEITGNPKLVGELSLLQEQLQNVNAQLLIASVKTKALDNCYKRSQELLQQLSVMMDDRDSQWIRWFEIHKKSFTFSRTPLDITTDFQKFMHQHQAVWIFTSATLTVANQFKHFSASLGLDKAKTISWGSPFDYAKQSLFYHPKGLPQPSAEDFIPRILEFVVPVLEASKGRAFFLFTSHRSLKQAEMLLQGTISYPLLVQGNLPKAKLISEFKASGNAVLLGTSSFWEGVDVRGEALSCVIIEKLPFSSPGDPVLKARLRAMEQQGKNPFFEYQLPNAVIALKQGVGRLVRDINDRGVLMVCDPRLLKRAYGQMFLDSVPPMRRTRELTDVQHFFQGGQ